MASMDDRPDADANAEEHNDDDAAEAAPAVPYTTNIITTSSGSVQISTPELLWHGGGNENGKTDPVYSVDMHPLNVLATAGIDANVPPKGSVRLWNIAASQQEKPEFLIDLNDHVCAVNGVRFSPCGKMLASASYRQIIVYKVADAAAWPTVTDPKQVEKIFIRPSLEEIYDIQWSPDSQFVLAGAINSRAEIVRVLTKEKESLVLCGHTGYVQGVAWDPRNEMVVTQSADRSCKVHIIKHKPGAMVKLAGRGHVVAKMLANAGFSAKVDATEAGPSNAADPLADGADGVADAPAPGAQVPVQKPKNLYADSTVPSFFRRPAFSPDGSFLVTPTGIHRPFHDTTAANDENKSAAANARQLTSYVPPEMKKSFCTYIYSRAQFHVPAIALFGLEEPSVAVRCSPVLYKVLDTPQSSASASASASDVPPPKCMIPGRYRVVFAVVTISAVLLYDTQHEHPIARFGGLHLACINDAAWSADGRTLVVCSSDGYLSFFRFAEGVLGESIAEDDVPLVVKRAFPYLYKFEDTLGAAEGPANESKDESKMEEEGEVSAAKEEMGMDAAAGAAAPATENMETEEKVVEGASVEAAADDAVQSSSSSADPSSSSSSSGGAASGEKKRKRITPTVVGCLGSVPASAGNVAPVIRDAVPAGDNSQMSYASVGPDLSQQSASAGVTVATLVSRAKDASPAPAAGAAAAAAAAAGAAAPGSENKKKRITPILVSSHDAAFAQTAATTVIGAASITVPPSNTAETVVCDAVLSVAADGTATYTNTTHA